MASSSRSNRQVFDEVRKIWVKATPEEIVRQQLLRKMIQKLGYPKELLAVEKEIKEMPSVVSLSVPDRRIDVVCYAKGIHPDHPVFPLIVIECKDEPFDQKAVNQVIGYNFFIKAPCIAIANPEGETVGFWDADLQKYRFQRGFPGYLELLECVTLK